MVILSNHEPIDGKWELQKVIFPEYF